MKSQISVSGEASHSDGRAVFHRKWTSDSDDEGEATSAQEEIRQPDESTLQNECRAVSKIRIG